MPSWIGQYRGFAMELYFDSFSREYKLTLTGELRHTATLGSDVFGNIQRLDNVLEGFAEKKAICEKQLDNARQQLEEAKIEVEKPFPREEELKTKSERLSELNILLDMDKHDNELIDDAKEGDSEKEHTRANGYER